MKSYVCRYCGATEYVIKLKGQIGMYCSVCGRWMKWLSLSEFESIKNAPECIKVSSDLANGVASKQEVASKPCSTCGSTDRYLMYKGQNCGLFCANCDTWFSWVKKRELPEYRKKYFLRDSATPMGNKPMPECKGHSISVSESNNIGVNSLVLSTRDTNGVYTLDITTRGANSASFNTYLTIEYGNLVLKERKGSGMDIVLAVFELSDSCDNRLPWQTD